MIYSKVMDFLSGTSRAYRQIPDAAMADLARFCRADESCVMPGDHDRTMLLEGRREVWLRIAQHRRLTPEQLFNLYGGVVPTKEQNQ